MEKMASMKDEVTSLIGATRVLIFSESRCNSCKKVSNESRDRDMIVG